MLLLTASGKAVNALMKMVNMPWMEVAVLHTVSRRDRLKLELAQG